MAIRDNFRRDYNGLELHAPPRNVGEVNRQRKQCEPNSGVDTDAANIASQVTPIHVEAKRGKMKAIIGFILLPLGIGCLVMAFAAFQIRDLQERPFDAKKEPLALAYALADFIKSFKGEEKQASKTTAFLAALGVILTMVGVALIKS